MATNDLKDFMQSATREMQQEYERIQKRATEDPGTAGDQGEENWATLLREWLPPTFQIVTKGRLLNDKGIASPQIDIIILRPEYPKKLLDKKLYLLDGALAVFECKITLKANHIQEFIESSVTIKGLFHPQSGSIYKELHAPLLYGLLAHSHNWNSPESKPIDNIQKKLIECDEDNITHPRQMPDILCVADLACWSALKMIYTRSEVNSTDNTNPSMDNKGGETATSYMQHGIGAKDCENDLTPIGVLLSSLLYKLAWEYPSLRPLAKYFRGVGLQGSGHGPVRHWTGQIFSPEARYRIQNDEFSYSSIWDESYRIFH